MKKPQRSSAPLKRALPALLIAAALAAPYPFRANAQSIKIAPTNPGTQSQQASSNDDFLSATPRSATPTIVRGYAFDSGNASTVALFPQIAAQVQTTISDDPQRLHLGGGLSEAPEEGAANAPGAAENRQGCAYFNELLKKFMETTVEDESAFEQSLKPIAENMFSSFLTAAKKDNPAACCNLAACYYYGFGTLRNLDLARQWYQRGNSLGDKRGARGLGLCLQAQANAIDNKYAEDGRKTDTLQNLEAQIVELYSKGVFNMDLRAYSLLGRCYLDGVGGRANSDRALQIFRKGGEEGSGSAYSNAGFCYASGFGVNTADKKEAFKYYTLGAKLKSAVASYNLAVAYLKGDGTYDDVSLAYQYFWLSASLGYPKAYMQLSNCCLNGIGVRANKAAALSWLKKAALLDDPDACYILAVNYLDDYTLTDTNRTLEQLEGMKWLYRSALLGNSDAFCKLGFCYQNGDGVEQSDRKAFSWFDRASQLESSAACLELAKYYAKGIVVPANQEEADRLNRRARLLSEQRAQKTTDSDYKYRLGFCFNMREQAPNSYISIYDPKNPLQQLFYRPEIPRIPQSSKEVVADLFLPAPASTPLKGIGYTDEIDEEITKLFKVEYDNIVRQLKMPGSVLTMHEASDVGVPGAAKNNEGCAAYREAAALLLHETGEEIPMNAIREKLDLAVRCFRESSNLGNGAGSLNLSECFYNGVGVELDFVQALNLAKKAIAEKEPRAYRALARCYSVGNPIVFEPEEAFKLYQTGASLGDVRCYANLGYCYLAGIGVEENRDKALEEYRKGVEAGDGNAAYELLMAQTKEEMDLSLLHLAAERGVGRACVKLSGLALRGFDPANSTRAEDVLRQECYEELHGDANGRERDPLLRFEEEHVPHLAAALDYLYRGVELGDENAVARIQNLTASYLHVPYNDANGEYRELQITEENAWRIQQNRRFTQESTQRWARRAAELGFFCHDPMLRAAVNEISAANSNLLATAFEAGNSSAKEVWDATEQLFSVVQKSAETGNAKCYTLLGLCYLNGMGTAKNTQLGLEWLQKGADLGDGDAFNYIGDHYYYNGNYTKALEFYYKGVALESGACCNSIGVCYGAGQGVPQNRETALKWYERGARRGNANAVCNLALYYESKGDLTRAMECFATPVDFPNQRYIDAETRLYNKLISGKAQSVPQQQSEPQRRGWLFQRW